MPEGRRSSLWLSGDIIPLVDFMTKHYNLPLSKVFRLALLGLAEQIDKEETYKGLNLKEYGETLERKELRELQGIFRAEHTSRTLLMKRIKYKMRTLILNGATTTDVVTLLEEYKKEAKHYKDSEEITKEIDNLIEKGKKDIKELEEQKKSIKRIEEIESKFKK